MGQTLEDVSHTIMYGMLDPSKYLDAGNEISLSLLHYLYHNHPPWPNRLSRELKRACSSDDSNNGLFLLLLQCGADPRRFAGSLKWRSLVATEKILAWRITDARVRCPTCGAITAKHSLVKPDVSLAVDTSCYDSIVWRWKTKCKARYGSVELGAFAESLLGPIDLNVLLWDDEKSHTRIINTIKVIDRELESHDVGAALLWDRVIVHPRMLENSEELVSERETEGWEDDYDHHFDDGRYGLDDESDESETRVNDEYHARYGYDGVSDSDEDEEDRLTHSAQWKKDWRSRRIWNTERDGLGYRSDESREEGESSHRLLKKARRFQRALLANGRTLEVSADKRSAEDDGIDSKTGKVIENETERRTGIRAAFIDYILHKLVNTGKGLWADVTMEWENDKRQEMGRRAKTIGQQEACLLGLTRVERIWLNGASKGSDYEA